MSYVNENWRVVLNFNASAIYLNPVGVKSGLRDDPTKAEHNRTAWFTSGLTIKCMRTAY